MKRLLATLVLATMAIGPAMAQPQAPAPAASAASAPRPVDKPLLAPMKMPQPEAPAVQRSKEAAFPGDLRPERQNVPQLNLPFGKGSRGAGPTTGGIDDSVARCRAKRTSEEREACEARLDI